MSEDLWQKELARVSREQEEEDMRRLDERWDRLSEGTLTAEEEAELRALASTSEDAARAWEAFRPLGADFQARVVQKIREKKSGKVLPWRRTLVTLGLGSSVAAAALLVVVLLPAPLPDYAPAEVSGGTSVWRGEDTAAARVPVLAPGDRFRVGLRPATENPVQPLAAECFLLRGQELYRLAITSAIDPGGAVRVEGTIGDGVPPGAWTLWSVVGRSGRLPDPEALRSSSGKVRKRDWVAIATEIRIQPRPAEG
ncbi:MAG TPA: hypothetical protein DD490_01435 [Acidobacteria bacterium]|nr:hypothetical protein [Acidobacteriota bacterium]